MRTCACAQVSRSPIFLLDCLLKSVGVGLEGAGIDDPLVDQLVTLVVGKGVEVIGFGITHNLVCFEDLGLAPILLRVLDFAASVFAHDLIFQLGFAFTVEMEAMHFTFNVSVLCFVLDPVTNKDSFLHFGNRSKLGK